MHRRPAAQLDAIIPSVVVRELKKGQGYAHTRDCVILFADLVGFTALSGTMSPKDVAAMVRMGQLELYFY